MSQMLNAIPSESTNQICTRQSSNTRQQRYGMHVTEFGCACGWYSVFTISYSFGETCVSTNRSITQNGFILDLTLWIMTVVMTSFGAWRWHLRTRRPRMNVTAGFSLRLPLLFALEIRIVRTMQMENPLKISAAFVSASLPRHRPHKPLFLPLLCTYLFSLKCHSLLQVFV